MTQTNEEPEPAQHTFFFVAAVTVDESLWRSVYGDEPIVPQSVADWLSYQYIGSAQQGVDVFTIVDMTATADADKLRGLPKVASSDC